MFSLSFRSFLSLYLATKEKEKNIKKTFYFKKFSYFFFFIAIKEEKVSKKKKLSLFSALLRALNKMDVAGEPALSRSLKNARGAIVVHFKFLTQCLQHYFGH